MSLPPFFVRVTITVQYCDHPHNLSMDQRFWSSHVSWRQTAKQYPIGNQQNFIVSFVIESPYEVIKTGSSALKSSIFLQFVSKIKNGVVHAPASNIPYELKNTVGKDVMSVWSPLDMAFCTETVKDVINFDFFPGVQINKVQALVITIDFSSFTNCYWDRLRFGEIFHFMVMKQTHTSSLYTYNALYILVSSSLGGICMVVETQIIKMVGCAPYIGYFFGHMTI